MVNKPKNQGTARETWWVRALHSIGCDAQRSPNNAASRDVDATIGNTHIRWEVKDRQTLNLHQTVNDATEANPGHVTGVIWHRFKKTEGSRRASMGTVIVFNEDVGLHIIDHLNRTGWTYP
jgi:hypothetical protein